MEQIPSLDMTPLEALLTDQITPVELAGVLDEVMVEYSCFNLSRPAEVCKGADDKVIWLRNLRDAIGKTGN